MNKVLFFISMLFAQSAFADSQNFQMVLDKAHEQGFYGCDGAIKRFTLDRQISHVEVKLLSDEVENSVSSSGDNNPLRVYRSKPELANAISIRISNDDGAHSYSSYIKFMAIRKIAGQCYIEHEVVIRENSTSCEEQLAMSSTVGIAGGDRNFTWVKTLNEKNTVSHLIQMETGSGRCVAIETPRFERMGIAVDSFK